MPSRLAAILLLLLLPIFLAGCFIPTDRDIASKLEDALRSKLHPQYVKVVVHRRAWLSTTVRNLDITISGFKTEKIPLVGENAAPATSVSVPAKALAMSFSKKPSFISNVRIVNAHIRCENFSVRNLPIHSMDIKMHEVRIPLQNKDMTIDSAESSTLAVTFSEDGINQFLQKRHLPVNDPQVRLSKDGCIVNGKIPFFFNTPVELSGRILSKEPAILYLEQPKVRVSSLVLPSVVSNRLLKEINPLTDLNTDFNFPVPITITKTTHGDHMLTFDAILHFPQRRH